MSPENKIYDDKMMKTIEVVKANFASVRAGRANAGVLDRISVEYYGTPTPLNQVAAISSPEPKPEEYREQFLSKISSVIEVIESDAPNELKGEALRSIVHHITFTKDTNTLEFHYFLFV